jgi:hypothetical protein
MIIFLLQKISKVIMSAIDGTVTFGAYTDRVKAMQKDSWNKETLFKIGALAVAIIAIVTSLIVVGVVIGGSIAGEFTISSVTPFLVSFLSASWIAYSALEKYREWKGLEHKVTVL